MVRTPGNRPLRPGAPHAGATPSITPIGDILTRAVAEHRAGRINQAEALYRAALAREPANPDVLHLLGVALHQRSRSAEAVDMIGRAVALAPNVPIYRNNMGAALRALGRVSEALIHYRKAVELAPNYVEALVNLGNSLESAGQTEEAATQYRRALALDPNHVEAHTGLGGALLKLEQTLLALRHLARAVELEPRSGMAHSNLGAGYLKDGKRAEAEANFRRAVALAPDLAEAHFNLGALLHDEERSAEAYPALERAVALDPRHALGLNTLGLVMEDLGRLDRAAEIYRRAIAVDPGFALAHNNLGNVFKNEGRRADAIAAYTQAIEADPSYADAISNRSLARLTLGQFEDGWRDYEARDSVRSLLARLWRQPIPDNLSAMRVFVLRDQGLGDEIFFLRFVPQLKSRGAWIAYLADRKIASLTARLPFIDEVHVADQEPGEIAMTLSLADLPWLLGMKSAAEIPPAVQIPPEPERLAKMRGRLASFGPPPYAGVTWRAGLQKRNSLSKLAPLAGIGRALRPIDCRVIAVQRLPAAGEIETLSAAIDAPVHDATALNDDLEDMLALLAVLDDYIAVSNTNVHLRASAGRASRVLVPNPPDFRWMAEGSESPWFPGTPLYRGTVTGEWRPALERLATDLARALPPRRSQ